MTEHVHEWGFVYQGHDIASWCDYECIHCGTSIDGPSITKRLNATERLSARRAKDVAEYGSLYSKDRAAVIAYADTLESTCR